MRAVLQRVTRASVSVDGEVVGAIERPGLLALVGVTHDDGPDQVELMARKIAELRILQAPVEARLPPARPAARPVEPLTHEVAHIADPGLRGALARLGAGVRAGR